MRRPVTAGGRNMGIVIDFPMSQRMAPGEGRGDVNESAQVVILPVIRIERMPDTPASGVEGARSSRKRRRRAQRS